MLKAGEFYGEAPVVALVGGEVVCVGCPVQLPLEANKTYWSGSTYMLSSS